MRYAWICAVVFTLAASVCLGETPPRTYTLKLDRPAGLNDRARFDFTTEYEFLTWPLERKDNTKPGRRAMTMDMRADEVVNVVGERGRPSKVTHTVSKFTYIVDDVPTPFIPAGLDVIAEIVDGTCQVRPVGKSLGKEQMACLKDLLAIAEPAMPTWDDYLGKPGKLLIGDKWDVKTKQWIAVQAKDRQVNEASFKGIVTLKGVEREFNQDCLVIEADISFEEEVPAAANAPAQAGKPAIATNKGHSRCIVPVDLADRSCQLATEWVRTWVAADPSNPGTLVREEMRCSSVLRSVPLPKKPGPDR